MKVGRLILYYMGGRCVNNLVHRPFVLTTFVFFIYDHLHRSRSCEEEEDCTLVSAQKWGRRVILTFSPNLCNFLTSSFFRLMSRHRCWMITYHLDCLEEGQSFLQEISLLEATRYIAGQIEKCPTTNRLHVQAYLHLKNPKAMSPLKKLLGQAVHLEPRRGTIKEAIQYCTKLETRIWGPFTEGEEPHQGISSDLRSVCAAITDGEIKSIQQVMIEAPSTYCRNRNGLRDLIGNSIKARTQSFRNLTVEIWYGEAGTGKTRGAYERHEQLYSLEQSANASDVWFDGYEGEKVLLIDDFYGWIRFSFILKLLDGYRLKLPVKGSYTWAEWDHIIITSNSAPWNWYRWSDNMNWGAFKRRITKVIYFEKDKDPQDQVLHNNPDCHLNPRGTVCNCF